MGGSTRHQRTSSASTSHRNETDLLPDGELQWDEPRRENYNDTFEFFTEGYNKDPPRGDNYVCIHHFSQIDD